MNIPCIEPRLFNLTSAAAAAKTFRFVPFRGFVPLNLSLSCTARSRLSSHHEYAHGMDC